MSAPTVTSSAARKGLKRTAVKPSVVRLPESRSHAALGRHTSQKQVHDPMRLELMHQLRVPKRTLPGLVNHHFPRNRLQLLNEIMPVLPPHKQPPHLAPLPNLRRPRRARRRRLPRDLARGAVQKVRLVPLAGVEDGQPRCSTGGEEPDGGGGCTPAPSTGRSLGTRRSRPGGGSRAACRLGGGQFWKGRRRTRRALRLLRWRGWIVVRPLWRREVAWSGGSVTSDCVGA